MFGDHVLDRDVSLGSCSGEHESSRLDLVGNDRIIRPVQTADSLDADHVRSRALDPRAHAVEEVREIDDMGLFSSILDRCVAFRHDCSHDNVDGCAYGDDVHINVRSDKSVRPRGYPA